MELRHYPALLRRRWRAVVVCTLLGAGAAGLLTALATPQYESSATIYVSIGRVGQGDFGDGLYVIQRMNSFQDVARSDSFAEDVSESLGGEVDPLLLQELVTVTAIPDSVLLSLSATTPDPERSAEVSEAYAEEMAARIEELESPIPRPKDRLSATVTDEAEVPADPVSPRVVRNLTSGALLGLFSGLVVAWSSFGGGVARNSQGPRFLGSPRVAFGKVARRRQRR